MKKKILIIVLILSGIIFTQAYSETTVFTSFAANFLFKNNFHEVVPKRFYRSAEMSRTDLANTIKQYKIKTVIDLRLQDDYLDKETNLSEADVAQANNATYFHLPFSSKKAMQKDRLLALLDIYETAQTPILVHCASGTHRSGVASALWLMEKENSSPLEISTQLSLKYGFFKTERKLKELLQGKPTLDFVIFEFLKENGHKEQYRDWLKKNISNG